MTWLKPLKHANHFGQTGLPQAKDSFFKHLWDNYSSSFERNSKAQNELFCWLLTTRVSSLIFLLNPVTFNENGLYYCKAHYCIFFIFLHDSFSWLLLHSCCSFLLDKIFVCHRWNVILWPCLFLTLWPHASEDSRVPGRWESVLHRDVKMVNGDYSLRHLWVKKKKKWKTYTHMISHSFCWLQ